MQTVLDQSHLMPVTVSIEPTLAEYDHTLRLYPLPTAVSLFRNPAIQKLIPLATGGPRR